MYSTEFTQGMILPKKDSSNINVNSSHAASVKSAEKAMNGVQIKSSAPVKLNLKELETTTSMKCTAQDVYNALIRPEVGISNN
jgi:hypothetical protein